MAKRWQLVTGWARILTKYSPWTLESSVKSFETGWNPFLGKLSVKSFLVRHVLFPKSLAPTKRRLCNLDRRIWMDGQNSFASFFQVWELIASQYASKLHMFPLERPQNLIHSTSIIHPWKRLRTQSPLFPLPPFDKIQELGFPILTRLGWSTHPSKTT